MPKTTFYYAVRRYGDGDKGVRIYRIKSNQLVFVGDVDVAWGHDEEEAVKRFIENRNLSKSFYCQEL